METIQNFESKVSVCRWVSLDGVPSQGKSGKQPLSTEEVLSGEVPLLSDLRVRDPNDFRAGGLHENIDAWENITKDSPQHEKIMGWLREGVNVAHFLCHYEGTYKGVFYDSDTPTPRIFPNHASCKRFGTFIAETIVSRLTTGAVKVWGRVGETVPPLLVLPITIEPSKPRLCIDGRYLNLWMKDCPFSLDKLIDVSRYVYRNSFMTKCDDKSGYDHVLLQESSQQYFGFQWSGWWFVCSTLPFGWKESPFIYQSIGLVASSYLRSIGVPCSLYIDDRLNGELITPQGPWSTPFSDRSEEMQLSAATCAVYIVISLLSNLGYTIGLKKSVLIPTRQLEYLGLIIDSEKQAFRVPERKVQSFAKLREFILANKTIDIKTLQRFQGKCISLALAVPAAKLYIRTISAAIASGTNLGQVQMTDHLFQEVAHWRFLDKWSDVVPWREERHVQVSLSTDASSFGWGCVIHNPSGDQQLSDYWDAKELAMGIASKEMLAICRALESAPLSTRDCRVDVQVDSRVAIDTFNGQGSRKSPELTEVTKELYRCLSDRNLHLELFYVPSEQNQADAPSRRLSTSDAKLTPSAWQRVEDAFGGVSGHSFDMMALDSNVQADRNGNPLPHFTPWATPNSQGVNIFAQDLKDERHDLSNPYVFPPFALVAPVLKFVSTFHRPFTIVVPGSSPRQFWWPLLMAMSSDVLKIAREGDLDVLLFPSRKGYRARACSVALYACRVSRF